MSYFKNYLKDPMVAAIAPSSRYVMQKVIDNIDFKSTDSILEVGAGTGKLAKKILKIKNIPYIALEPNINFYSELRKVDDIRAINLTFDYFLAGFKCEEVDLILSSIPFSKVDRESMIKQMATISNRLIIFQQNTPIGLNKVLKKYYSSIKTLFEYRNIPPCFIYVCEGSKLKA